MHASLAELLENLKSGLLWVARDGEVRYANAEAGVRTGLATGRRLFDPDLMRAVEASVTGRVPRAVTAVGLPAAPDAAPSELKCRVIPGMAKDDAFVLISPVGGQDGSAAFENLMQAIRSDLHDPLRQAQTALSRLRVHEDLQPEHAALGEGLEQLLTVTDRLVELASLWDSSSLLANDRIELWPLLQRAWGEVEPLALQRGVKVRFRAQTEAAGLAALYGSERWLGRVFQECLESAVRSTRRDALLDIEHRQLGPRAVVVFRDSGVFAARDLRDEGIELSTGQKPAPGAKAAKPKLGAREQIGLKLCQHIVALHGGQLREEEEDGMRNFLVDLPTGAPHRADEAAIDVAQAQQYARDLSALMNRARRKNAAAGSGASQPG
jgi:signal transduction histidine kinase